MSCDASFSGMNETDVREEIIRPFLHKLGYRRGTDNNIRTEQTLRYPRQFLGHKNEKTDPALRGRADYICDVIPYARWVVEAKSPGAELTDEDAEQAHSYAAHPEVRAFYSLLTNGRRFRLYTILNSSPILDWTLDEMETRWVEISNMLCPEGIKRVAHLITPETGKPLAVGLKSVFEIVGGSVLNAEFVSNVPTVQESLDRLRGMRSTVVGDRGIRDAQGIIEISLRVAGAFEQIDRLNRLAGLEVYRFSTVDEFISIDADYPTIFQGMFRSVIPVGAKIGPPLFPTEMSLPFATKMWSFTQATGFIERERCRGTFVNQVQMEFDVAEPMRALIERVAPIQQEFRIYGDFEIVGQ